MQDTILKAQPRTIVGKQVKSLRRGGRLPAVIYGRNFEPVMITLDLHESTLILPTLTSSHLVTVDVNGVKHNVLVREKQRHAVTSGLLHVDFLEVSMTEKLRAEVMIELSGDAPAVKNYNGVIVTGIEELEVESLPSDLPERVVVDLSVLKEIGDAVHVRDIQFPPAVTVLTSGDEMIVLVAAPILDTELAAGEGGPAEPEVIERGKKEEDF
jgi:large subunit ribosomal protein L25